MAGTAQTVAEAATHAAHVHTAAMSMVRDWCYIGR